MKDLQDRKQQTLIVALTRALERTNMFPLRHFVTLLTLLLFWKLSAEFLVAAKIVPIFKVGIPYCPFLFYYIFVSNRIEKLIHSRTNKFFENPKWFHINRFWSRENPPNKPCPDNYYIKDLECTWQLSNFQNVFNSKSNITSFKITILRY